MPDVTLPDPVPVLLHDLGTAVEEERHPPDPAFGQRHLDPRETSARTGLKIHSTMAPAIITGGPHDIVTSMGDSSDIV